jgi:hypothetical protein
LLVQQLQLRLPLKLTAFLDAARRPPESANEDAEALFDAVTVGTPIVIAAARPAVTAQR